MMINGEKKTETLMKKEIEKKQKQKIANRFSPNFRIDRFEINLRID